MSESIPNMHINAETTRVQHPTEHSLGHCPPLRNSFRKMKILKISVRKCNFWPLAKGGVGHFTPFPNPFRHRHGEGGICIAKIAIKFFVKRIFTIFATIVSFLQIANLQI